ncbi:MAG: glycosyltransferase family 4 protein [Paraclostridium dentum]|uniref:glycosyltransferase family 4 protein n=1 Tax=Paraclostridium dentum TaxID=2662455 RepID=UPI003EE5A7B7
MSKILVNALQFSRDGAGISRYSDKISNNLINNYDNIDVLCRVDTVESFENKEQLIKLNLKKNRSYTRIIEEQIKSINLYKKYDLVHFLDYATPILYKGKKIATIHDMAMHTMKDKYTKGQIITKKILLENTINHADKLICISEFTANELLHYYPNVEESKIEIVYHGFEYSYKCISEKNQKEVLQKFNIKKNYLLFVGTLSPHKNIERIVEALSKIKRQGYDYQLVICGKKGWLYQEIFKKVKSLKLEDQVIFTDYVSDEELEVLYRNAKLFVFPSLYEGFGFPPIEAMARNIPVLTSREGALPEVVGNAAIFCDAYCSDDIAKKSIEILENDNLRKKLIQRGVDRVKYFSWNKAAYKVNQIYNKVL